MSSQTREPRPTIVLRDPSEKYDIMEKHAAGLYATINLAINKKTKQSYYALSMEEINCKIFVDKYELKYNPSSFIKRQSIVVRLDFIYKQGVSEYGFIEFNLDQHKNHRKAICQEVLNHNMLFSLYPFESNLQSSGSTDSIIHFKLCHVVMYEMFLLSNKFNTIWSFLRDEKYNYSEWNVNTDEQFFVKCLRFKLFHIGMVNDRLITKHVFRDSTLYKPLLKFYLKLMLLQMND
eukprot:77408_1